MSRGDNVKLGSTVALLAISIMLLSGAPLAAGIGTSTISVNSSSISVAPGHSAVVAYTVSLASGSTWGTTISASNQATLNGDGITLSFSRSYGDPTYTGDLTVLLSSTAVPGNYTISLIATGDDPSSGPANISLSVMSPVLTSNTPATSASNTTIPSTTVPSTTTIAASIYTPGKSSIDYGAIAAAIAIVIIVAIVACLLRRKR